MQDNYDWGTESGPKPERVGFLIKHPTCEDAGVLPWWQGGKAQSACKAGRAGGGGGGGQNEKKKKALGMLSGSSLQNLSSSRPEGLRQATVAEQKHKHFTEDISIRPSRQIGGNRGRQ